MTLLALAGGVPPRALEYAEQSALSRRDSFINDLYLLAEKKTAPLNIVQNCLKNELAELLYWMSTLVGDMIRLKSGISVQLLINCDVASLLQLLARKTQLQILFALQKEIERDLWLLKGQMGVNSQLLLEKLLIDWSLCFNEGCCEYA